MTDTIGPQPPILLAIKSDGAFMIYYPYGYGIQALVPPRGKVSRIVGNLRHRSFLLLLLLTLLLKIPIIFFFFVVSDLITNHHQHTFTTADCCFFFFFFFVKHTFANWVTRTVVLLSLSLIHICIKFFFIHLQIHFFSVYSKTNKKPVLGQVPIPSSSTLPQKKQYFSRSPSHNLNRPKHKKS